MSVTVKTDDKVWRKMLNTIQEIRTSDAHARVGVFGGSGAEDGFTMVELAAVHEFGSKDGHTPERSFIRRTFQIKQDRLAKMIAKLTTALLANRVNWQTALKILGDFGATEVKNTIRDGQVEPPLAASTIAAKGSSKPLVDTGQLIGSITWQVMAQ